MASGGATVGSAAAWWALPRRTARRLTSHVHNLGEYAAVRQRWRRRLAVAGARPAPRCAKAHPQGGSFSEQQSSGGGAGMAEVKRLHGEDTTKTLLKNEAIYEYMLNTVVYPREHECLRELRLITQKHTYGYMSSPPDEAQLLSMLLKLTGARKTIEVGVFTGCSVLATALAIPDDGKVVAIDVSREYFDLGMPVIQKAGVAHKVDFREGPAQPILEEMLAHQGNEGKFDFAFVDADKGNYGNYHEQLLRLVRVGGVLVYDNTLWGGTVAMPDETPLTEHDRRIRDFIRAFNAKIAADQRVEVVQLPIADGITLCRRVV